MAFAFAIAFVLYASQSFYAALCMSLRSVSDLNIYFQGFGLSWEMDGSISRFVVISHFSCGKAFFWLGLVYFRLLPFGFVLDRHGPLQI